MGMFDRFATMVRSNLNDLISRAENPEKMLNQLIVDMRSQLDKARQQVAQAIADEKKLEADSLAQKKQAEDWERRAMLAVQEGRDDLAKQALMRYNEALQGAQQLHDTWVKSKTETEALKASLRQLNDKIEEAKRKKNILIARARRAEAQQRIQETLSGMGDKSAFESFERMQEKIEANERKAIASAELNQEMSGDSLARAVRAARVSRLVGSAIARAQGEDGHDRRGQGHAEADRSGQCDGAGRRRAGGEAAPVVIDPKYLILADDDFGIMTSKTANAVIRYHPSRVVAVLDRQLAGQTSQQVLGFGGDIPVVGSVAEGLALGANSVLIGIAPQGGELPDEWRGWLREALEGGCDIVSGLHTFMSDDPVLAAVAKQHGRTILDARRPPADLPVASGLARDVDALVVLTVGTDCNVGKMTAQLQTGAGAQRARSPHPVCRDRPDRDHDRRLGHRRRCRSRRFHRRRHRTARVARRQGSRRRAGRGPGKHQPSRAIAVSPSVCFTARVLTQ